jgi:hypothetical protein
MGRLRADLRVRHGRGLTVLRNEPGQLVTLPLQSRDLLLNNEYPIGDFLEG